MSLECSGAAWRQVSQGVGKPPESGVAVVVVVPPPLYTWTYKYNTPPHLCSDPPVHCQKHLLNKFQENLPKGANQNLPKGANQK